MLPERDLVPLRTRWRDDKLIVGSAIMGGALLLVSAIVAIVFAIIR